MNIYLDIDGVLMGVESPIEDRIEFLEYVLEHYKDSTYWLTTHCNNGENNVSTHLMKEYPAEFVKKLFETIKPTDWGYIKTTAIDFREPFLWFDDDLFYAEIQDLERHGALDSYIRMNRKDYTMSKQALQILKYSSL